MGSYNSQYESYYNGMVNRRKNNSYGFNKKNKFILDGNFFLKRLQRDLIGVFVLFILVLACKIVHTSQTTYAYSYSKSLINSSFDYEAALSNVKNLDMKVLETKVSDWMDTAKTKITGGKTIKETLKSDYMSPVAGTLAISKDKVLKDGIDISVPSGTEIFSVYGGKIKEIGEDAKNGKYIIIDHGSGIETKYSKLNQIAFKNGDSITKGQVIGKIAALNNTASSFLHFELSYMGESLNPEEYLNLTNN
ncbi:M23 family metallopeptidase [Candidatus Clostridium radicumherbarum]|uniref:M23 family metallopeptidase n=1 Tax=Candidatus Clostridium radicumherbarum TaxID=3381662 RepID=A0ABW8TQJ5_9CLOT